MLGMVEVRTAAQGPMQDVVGDMVIVLDNNFQILWTWDAFDHLDVSQPAVLNETCAQFAAGCVLLQLNGDTRAADWTHTNSVALAPDGNLIISARHHDMVYKINFANGTGDGSILWRLGRNGDFTFLGGDPVWPWFSHQHDVEFESANTISLFDNGNTRSTLAGVTISRGQTLQLNETQKTATVVLDADLNSYSYALGTAQRLPNGNYGFTSGWTSSANTEITEVDPSGALVYRLVAVSPTCRTFRLRDLYSAPY